MQPILDNLASLGRTRLVMLGATGLALVLALFLGLGTVMAPTYAPLFRDLSPAGASRVVEELEQAGFPVKIEGGGGIVSVPQEDIARARMVLAGKGLPDEGTPGWELFDTGGGLGMNNFMQQINRLRALEGELTRSIQTIDGVEAARVHLVLPEREAFSRTRPEPSASVIVRSRASHQIGTRQGRSIRALVASAVPGMSPGRVTVLSASGETILAEDSDAAGEITLQSIRAGIEERMARSITTILTARVGAGNARVQVNVDLSNERQVIRQQSFDPSQQVVRSTESREEESRDTDRNSGEVGVANNIPEALADGAGGGAPDSENTRSQIDEIVNYEIGSTQSETVREPGEIERVTVAVLVNGIYNVGGARDVAYEDRSAEELARLEQLVKAAIGFDDGRGDTVSVDSLRFMDYSMDVGEPMTASIGDQIVANMPSILRSVFALALVAAILAFGVRPMMRNMLPAPAMAGDLALAGAGADAALGAPSGAAGLPAPEGEEGQAGDIPRIADAGHSGTVLDPGEGDDELIRLASVQGGVRRNNLASVGEMVDMEPDGAMKVLQHWLAEPT
ncbi:flagellar basal-body MS-ring/collar protein FliF [Profundibacterium mesophilum]|uniref:Flagellar M-ring protein n=1 Tax=Profundibacterium mesophilum KAUST100406-0324 TaxID=1037889 RepID=A0A921NPH4_9RHOB|nr:flagellar basal-body MS-ring/collar protein FliF [Profundibacterium mesophilum]KAF0674630.1 putative flagellar M-ring protein [Profundibacterium mesophilum KAUST100406-0324]